MRRLIPLFLFTFILLAAAGCQSRPVTKMRRALRPPPVDVSFLNGGLPYKVDQEALAHMERAKKVLEHRLGHEPTEEEIIPLYRDADINHDRLIESKEAASFARRYSRAYEDSLPSTH